MSYWHYVRDVLLPQIRSAKPGGPEPRSTGIFSAGGLIAYSDHRSLLRSLVELAQRWGQISIFKR